MRTRAEIQKDIDTAFRRSRESARMGYVITAARQTNAIPPLWRELDALPQEGTS